jgi:NADP-dependent aldehyde dehydrogenase
VQAENGDAVGGRLVDLLAPVVGRVLWNGWPTGVSVTYAMQHGGPYPATTAAGFTSVGTASIERFLRPVSYQGVPADVLPPELRDDNPLGVPQRVDGVLQPRR